MPTFISAALQPEQPASPDLTFFKTRPAVHASNLKELESTSPAAEKDRDSYHLDSSVEKFGYAYTTFGADLHLGSNLARVHLPE